MSVEGNGYSSKIPTDIQSSAAQHTTSAQEQTKEKDVFEQRLGELTKALQNIEINLPPGTEAKPLSSEEIEALSSQLQTMVKKSKSTDLSERKITPIKAGTKQTKFSKFKSALSRLQPRKSKTQSNTVTMRNNVQPGLPKGVVKPKTSLEELLKQAAASQPESKIPEKTQEIPLKQQSFISGLIAALREKHLDVEGLTRKAGQESEIKAMIESYERLADDPGKLQSKSPHDLATALKRELRTRSYIFGQEEMKKLLALGEGQIVTDAEGNIQLNPDDIVKLNEMNILDDHPNADIIQNLLRFGTEIVSHQERNKMGLSNIVMTLSPVIIHDDAVLGSGDASLMEQRTNAVMKMLAYYAMDAKVKLPLPQNNKASAAQKANDPDSNLTPEGKRQLKELQREAATAPMEWKQAAARTHSVARSAVEKSSSSLRIGLERRQGPTRSLEITHKERIENLISNLRKGAFDEDPEAALASLKNELVSGRPILYDQDLNVLQNFDEGDALSFNQYHDIEDMTGKLLPNNRVVLNQVLDLCLKVKNSENNDWNASKVGHALGEALFAGENEASSKLEVLMEFREIARGDKDVPIKHLDEIHKMFPQEKIDLSDPDFMLLFMEEAQRHAKSIGPKQVGDDYEFQEGADIKKGWTQATENATAEAMANAYESLNDEQKTEAKKNINDLARKGIMPERLFGLFYGRIDDGLIPDISFEPRRIATEQDISSCLDRLSKVKKEKRVEFASDMAESFRQYQLQKCENLNLTNITDANDETLLDLINFVNATSDFFATAIVTGGMDGTVPDQRVIRRMIKTTVLIGKKSIDIGDYSTAHAVLSALSKSSVESLIKECQFKHDGNTQRYISELEGIFDPSMNFQAVKDHMSERDAITVVPPLYIISKNLYVVNDTKPDLSKGRFNTEKAKMILKEIKPLANLRESKEDSKNVQVKYKLSELPRLGENDLYLLKDLQREVRGTRTRKGDFLSSDDIKAFEKAKEGKNIDVSSRSGKKKLVKFTLKRKAAEASLDKILAKSFNAETVESILSHESHDWKTKGKELSRYLTQPGMQISQEEKEAVIAMLNDPDNALKIKQTEISMGLVETLLRDDRNHFPLLKDLLQISFQGDIEKSVSQPSTLLRGESIGTRMASQTYRILGREFENKLSSLIQDLLTDESLEIQPSKIPDGASVDMEERQDKLIANTAVIYSAIRNNKNLIPEEMVEIFKMVHDEVKNAEKETGEAAFEKQAAINAFNSQLYLRFITPILTDTSFKLREEGPDKQRALLLMSKIIQNHANNVSSSIKEPHMNFMFEKAGNELKENMMKLTQELVTGEKKPKGKWSGGKIVKDAARRAKTAAHKPKWHKTEKMAGGHRPRSASEGTAGSHRKSKREAELPESSALKNQDIASESFVSDFLKDDLSGELKGRFLADNYMMVRTAHEERFIELFNNDSIIRGFVEQLMVEESSVSKDLILYNSDILSQFVNVAKETDDTVCDKTLTEIGNVISQFLLGREFFDKLEPDKSKNAPANVDRLFTYLNQQITGGDYSTFLANIRPTDKEFFNKFVISRLESRGYPNAAESVKKFVNQEVNERDDIYELQGKYEILSEKFPSSDDANNLKEAEKSGSERRRDTVSRGDVLKAQKSQEPQAPNIVEEVTSLASSYSAQNHQEVVNRLSSLLTDEADSEALISVFIHRLGDEKTTQFLHKQITHEFDQLETNKSILKEEAYKLLDKESLSYKVMKNLFDDQSSTELKEKLLRLSQEEYDGLTFEEFDLSGPLESAVRLKHHLTYERIREAFDVLPNDAKIREGAQKAVKCLLLSFMVDSGWLKSENEQEKLLANRFNNEFPDIIIEQSIKKPGEKPLKPLPPLKIPGEKKESKGKQPAVEKERLDFDDFLKKRQSDSSDVNPLEDEGSSAA